MKEMTIWLLSVLKYKIIIKFKVRFMARIMLVDDSRISRIVIGDLLIGLGHKVEIEATSGEEAVEKYDKERIDCVLMNVEMGGISGIEATKILTTQDPDAKVIIVSSVSEANRIKDAFANGAKGNVQKPVNREVLSNTIASMLEFGMEVALS